MLNEPPLPFPYGWVARLIAGSSRVRMCISSLLLQSDRLLYIVRAQAQSMCSMLPGFPGGMLATLFSAEDLEYFSRVGAVAEGDAPNLWVGFGDLLSPGKSACVRAAFWVLAYAIPLLELDWGRGG